MIEASVRAEIRRWLRDQVSARIAEDQEVNLPELANDAQAEFIRDAAFNTAMFNAYARPALYEEARLMIRDTRGEIILMGDIATTRQRIRDRAAALQKKWDSFLEHAGDRHVLVLQMTREDLLIAAVERERQAHTNIAYATLWRSMAADLRPRQKVGNKFSAVEIETRLANILGALRGTPEGEEVSGEPSPALVAVP